MTSIVLRNRLNPSIKKPYNNCLGYKVIQRTIKSSLFYSSKAQLFLIAKNLYKLYLIYCASIEMKNIFYY